MTERGRFRPFGQFLIESGSIGVEELARAIAVQRNETLRVGGSAMAMGKLTQGDVDRILRHQWERNLPFGQAACELGLLGQEDLEALLSVQLTERRRLGEILVALGALTADERDYLLAAFHEDQTGRNSIPGAMRRSRLLSRLHPTELTELAAIARVVTYEPNQRVYGHGEAADFIHMIELGAVRLDCPAEAKGEIGCLMQGDVLGLEATLSRSCYAESATTITRTTLLTFAWEDLHRLLIGSAGISALFLGEVSRGWRKRTENTASLAGPSIFVVILPHDGASAIARAVADEWERQSTGATAVLMTDNQLSLSAQPQVTAGPFGTRFLFSPATEESAFLDFLQTNVEKLRRFRNVLVCVEPTLGTLCRQLQQLSSRMAILCTHATVSANLLPRPDADRLFALRSPERGNDLWTQLHSAYHRLLWPSYLEITKPDRWTPTVVRFLKGATVGIALGGGGARGMAHIGVLQTLGEMGVPIDLVAGSSAGCAVGGVFALHGSPEAVRELWERHAIRPRKHPFSDYSIIPRRSLIRGRRFQSLLLESLQERRVCECAVAFLPVASNMRNGAEEILSNALLREAIEASAAAPGLLPPVRIGAEVYCDGGLVNNVPASVLREYGAGRVLAVNVSAEIESGVFNADSLLSALTRGLDILMSNAMRLQRSAADLELKPDVGAFGLMDYRAGDAIIAAGSAVVAENADLIDACCKSQAVS